MSPLWKKIALGAFAISIIGLIVYFKTNVAKPEPTTAIDPAFAAHISAYTAGMLPSDAVLNIEFTREMVDSSSIGQAVSEKLFDFSPALSGEAVWQNTRTIRFTPEARMKSGERYRAQFFLSKLVDDLPKTLRTFQYSFRVIPQNFDLQVINTKSYSKTNFAQQKIHGALYTADYAVGENVERMIEATQSGKALPVEWTHGANGREHHFIVSDVARTSKPGSVVILAKGNSLGVQREEETTVEVPAIDDFKLMNARVVQSPTQYVVLQFSDPVQEDQNLNGLIRLTNLPDLDFDIIDNEIRVYPPVRQSDSKTITIEGGVRNIQKKRLGSPVSLEVVFEQVKPAVRFTSKGSILPATDGLVVPFEAVNLSAVDVQITKVYEKNVLQFLQVNNLSGNSEMRRVGNRILRKKIPLQNAGIVDPGKWNRYTLDISKLIQSEPGAIYEVRLGFQKAYSTFACGTSGPPETLAGTYELTGDTPDDSYAGPYNMTYYEGYYYGPGYDWRERDNPCNISYYTPDRAATKNIIASDIGLTVKHGAGDETLAVVTDLRTATPLPGVSVTLHSFQLREIGTGITDAEGKVVIKSSETPFAVVAKHGQQKAYLRLVNGEALMVSSFDVSGDVVDRGLKGFLYGERGVWRPGDSLHLTFILEDKRKTLPPGHPVVFELSDPRGQVVRRAVRALSENGFYNFATATSPDALTGDWLGRVKVGGATFTKNLKIETVKPNRLKIELNFGREVFTSPDINGQLQVNWLHGAPGRNLKAEFDVLLLREPTHFKSFPDYHFDDPSRTFESESQALFEGTTNAEGRATVSGTLEVSGEPSGMLNAVFRGKVYEEGGNFSIYKLRIPYYPYTSFVGLRVPEGEQYSGILYTDTDHEIALATVDASGNAISRKDVEVDLYKLNWRWWWDNSSEHLANFVEGSYSRLVKSETVDTHNGKGSWTLNLPAAEYGRYFLRVCDPVSGHCAGQIIYVDEPGWYSRARDADARGGANLLAFSTDKTKYNIGEKINVTIPGAANGRALVSVENGSKVLQTFWVETEQGETRFTLDATREMAPNAYIHVSLLQPHEQTVNDLPIRLYGITPVQVEDPGTHLTPVLSIPDELVPGEEVVVRVSEKNNRKMTYTVAVVDEGLLDLTRFQTPDPWHHFYAREALGVRTWDLFDDVIGAYGANLERFISIGGDDAIAPGEIDPLANRFKPVVKFFGPYTLDRGAREIRFVMPEYIGSVRTMVVAGYEGAYGATEKTSKVRKPLMVLATLPRVLGPEEAVKLPVTVFSGETRLDKVTVEVSVKGPVSVKGAASQTTTLTTNADKTIDFDLDVGAMMGVATVEVKARAGGFTARDVIEIQVRNPNTPVTRVEEHLLEPQARWSSSFTPFGIAGTNSATLELSTLPPINLDSRMRYLMQYPHGCVEQIASALFPQLYLGQVRALTDVEQKAIQRNITTGIEKLKSFVQADGGFGYWPGVAESADSWGTSYAGHFLVEAKKKGYYVPADLLDRWRTFQRDRAAAWRRNPAYPNSDLMQAYRLYSLAVAGAPELGAMNRLREETALSPTAAWTLAASYAVSGQQEAARALVEDLPVEVEPYRELGYSYGSGVRDKALILETLVLLGDRTKAFEVVKEISNALGNENVWMSTQETATCLRAIASFAANEKQGELKFDYQFGDGKKITASTALPVAEIALPLSGTKPHQIIVENKGTGSLFVRLLKTGTPARGAEARASNGLALRVSYTDTNGNPIDVSRLEQGTGFIAEVTVKHPGIRGAYENLALTQVFPSGWEINNLRLEGAEAFIESSPYRYQDIRDDRVFTYFNLSPNEERTFRIMLTATYAGTFYLPAASCQAMYDGSINAAVEGREVTVVKAAQ